MAQAPERVLPLGEDTPLSGLSWSPSGDRLAARTSASQIVLIDAHSGKTTPIPEQAQYYAVNGPSWSPDGRFLAILFITSGGQPESEAIHIWDVSRLTLVREAWLRGLQKWGHGQTIVGFETSEVIRDRSLISWSPRGDVVAVDSGITGLSVWDTSKGKLLRQFGQGNQFLSWSADGRVLHAQDEHQIRFLDRLSGGARVVIQDETILQGQAAVSPDGKSIAAVVDDRQTDEIDLWLAGSNKPVHQIPSPPQFDLVNYAVSPDNGHIGLDRDPRLGLARWR